MDDMETQPWVIEIPDIEDWSYYDWYEDRQKNFVVVMRPYRTHQLQRLASRRGGARRVHLGWFGLLFCTPLAWCITYIALMRLLPVSALPSGCEKRRFFAAYILILGLRQRFKTAADKADHGMQSKAGWCEEGGVYVLSYFRNICLRKQTLQSL